MEYRVITNVQPVEAVTGVLRVLPRPADSAWVSGFTAQTPVTERGTPLHRALGFAVRWLVLAVSGAIAAGVLLALDLHPLVVLAVLVVCMFLAYWRVEWVEWRESPVSLERYRVDAACEMRALQLDSEQKFRELALQAALIQLGGGYESSKFASIASSIEV